MYTYDTGMYTYDTMMYKKFCRCGSLHPKILLWNGVPFVPRDLTRACDDSAIHPYGNVRRLLDLSLAMCFLKFTFPRDAKRGS